MRRIAPVLRLLLAFLLPGCLSAENQVYLLPDGSGKVDVRAIYSTSLSEMIVQADSVGEDMAPTFTVADIEEARKLGIAAYVESAQPMPRSKGAEGTFYFDDITKLKFCDSPAPDCPAMIRYELIHDGGSHRLTVVDTMLAGIAQLVANGSEEDLEDEEFRSLVQGMGISYACTVPGRIVSVEGFQAFDGRTAKYAIDEAGIIAAIRAPAKRSSVPRRLSLTWSSADVPEKEIAEFRKEMEAAKRKFEESARK